MCLPTTKTRVFPINLMSGMSNLFSNNLLGPVNDDLTIRLQVLYETI